MPLTEPSGVASHVGVPLINEPSIDELAGDARLIGAVHDDLIVETTRPALPAPQADA